MVIVSIPRPALHDHSAAVGHYLVPVFTCMSGSSRLDQVDVSSRLASDDVMSLITRLAL